MSEEDPEYRVLLDATIQVCCICGRIIRDIQEQGSKCPLLFTETFRLSDCEIALGGDKVSSVIAGGIRNHLGGRHD